MKMRILIESTESCFPERVQIELKPRDILKINTEANNYGMMLIFCVLSAYSGIIIQFKKIFLND